MRSITALGLRGKRILFPILLAASFFFVPETSHAAITGITARGSAVSNAAGTTLSVSPTANLTAGKVVFVSCVSDNNQTTDGASTLHSLSDTQGHTWTKVYEGTETDGAADDGVTVSVFATKIITQIGTGNSITLTLGTSKTDKIITIFEATFGAGKTFAVAQTGIGQNSLTASVSSLTSREYLLIGAGGAEGEDNAKTPSTNYTERFDLITSTTGNLDVNVAIHVQTRIATLTSDSITSSAWTFTNAFQTLSAIYEIDETLTVSGTVWTNEAKTTNIGANKTVHLFVNGTDKSTAETDTNGAYSFASVMGFNANDSVIVYLDGETEDGSTVTLAISGITNITALDIITSHISLEHRTSGPLTNTDLDDVDGVDAGDEDGITIASGNATFADTFELSIVSGKTYTPGGTVTCDHFEAEGTATFSPAGNAVTVSGNWEFSGTGTFTTSGTVTFDGGAAETIITGGKSWSGLTLNNTGADGATDNLTISGTLDVNGTFSITNGDLDLDTNDPAINTAGDVSIGSSAFVTPGSGTWTFDGTTQSVSDSSSGQNIGTVSIGPSTTTTVNTGSAITMGSVTVGGNDTLNISNDTLTLTASGTPLSITAGGVFTITASTVAYAGSGSQTISAVNYENLTSSGSGARTLASSGTIGIAGAFTPGTNSYTITGSTIDFNGLSSQTIPAFNYYNLTSSGATVFSPIQSATNSDNTDLTINVNGVGAGRLLVAWAKWEGASGGTGIESISDGTSSFSLGTLRDSGTDMHSQFAYLTSANGGDKTYTLSINGTETFVDWTVAEFSYTGTIAFDTQATNSGNGTALTSGNITLAGTPSGLVIGGGSSYQAVTYTNRNINNTAAQGTIAGRSYASMWHTRIASGTLDADATVSAGDLWVANIIAFKTTSGGGGARTLASSGTIGIAGAFTPGLNTYTVTGSTVAFNGSATQTVNANFKYHNLQVVPSANSVTTSFATGTVTVNGDLTIGNGTNTGIVVSANANSTTITVAGSLSIASATTFQANASNTLTIGDDFTNNGTFTHNNGTVSFNDNTKTSTLLYAADTTFFALSVTTAGKSLQFDEAQKTTVTGSLTIQGTNCSTGRVFLDSAVNDNLWDLTTTGATVNIDYADVEDANAVTTAVTADNSTADNNNNTNWTINGGSCSGNTAPNVPASLTQKTSADGTIGESAWTSSNTPKLGFTLTDPDTNTVTYRVQVASDSGFSSPLLDYAHGTLSASGTVFTFIVGSYGGGTCTGTCPSTLSDTSGGYWWRVKAIDVNSAESSFVEFGTPGTVDFKVDATAPSGGTVYDGTSGDQDWNDGSLTSLSGNWTGFNANVSGLSKYEYAIKRQPDNFSWDGDSWESAETWTDNATATSFTRNSMNLETGVTYFVSVRTTDAAGNVGTPATSNGQQVLPLLSFSLSANTVSFNNLNAANSYTDTKTITTTTSTNAKNGYTVKVYNTDALRGTSIPSAIIPDFSGTWNSPASWGGGQYGFGYTSNDTSVQGSNRFSGGTAFSAFSQSPPGDVVADHTDTVNGGTGSISNEQFTLTYKVSASTSQAALRYETRSIFIVTANY